MFRKRHPETGARPGTLVILPDAPTPVIKVIQYDRSHYLENDVANVDTLGKLIENDLVNWIDVQGFGDQALFESFGRLFNIHPLALEDIVNVPQRPKIEAYGDQLLLIVRMITIAANNHIDVEQVSIVVGKNYVLTFQEKPGDVLEPVRNRIRLGNSIRSHGADYLAYALVDTVVDAYYPVLEAIGDYLEPIEDQVIFQPTPALLAELNRMKNQLVNLRRAIWPQREAVSSMFRDDHPLISQDVRIYLRDTYDHCVQTVEVAEMYREMIGGLLNLYLTSVANRTNDVMKVLTIVATIFIPLTFLAGIYGMNFQYMPELAVKWAYPAFWGAILVITVFMSGFFWRKGWIKLGP